VPADPALAARIYRTGMLCRNEHLIRQHIYAQRGILNDVFSTLPKVAVQAFSTILVGNQIADFVRLMAGTSDSDDRAQIVHVGA
jgi:hypothetical protein